MKFKLNGAKIIFVFWGSELGGAERQGLFFARYMKYERGADVHICGLGAEKSGRVTELCAEYGLPWQAITFNWAATRTKRLCELFRFAWRLRKEKPDVLLPYTDFPNVVCGLTWRFTGAKYCLWNQRDEGLGLNTSLLHRWAVRFTSSFISNSKIGKEELMRIYNINENSVKVIHNGVSMSDPVYDRAAWRRRLEIPDDCFVAVMVANLNNYKDHRTLLNAWKKVLDSLKSDVRPPPILLLAGRFDSQTFELKAIAYDLELGKSIEFLDKIDDISGLLIASDLCVHSSKSEGLPNSVLEAMASGLPIVGSNIPGIREAVGAENIKYLAVAGNACELADKILLFARDYEICRSVGSRNRQIIDNNFPVKKMCMEMSAQIASQQHKGSI